MLKIKGLEKSFGKTKVLKHINLEIQKGEILVVVGPSGGGKTTLLRCINILEKCDNGTIEIDNNILCEKGIYVERNRLSEIRRDIGLVFQNFNLFPHKNILENIIEAPQRVLGISKNQAIKEAVNILEKLGLIDKQGNYPCELSGGQKQRVAIGRALAMKPKLMCFDEPTSALDPELTDEVASLIRGLAKEGMSMLIITHDMKFAKKVADKMYSMNNGILEEGLIFEK